ncbi:hypothetical protein NPIL_160031 [Nephila pilipes]|uniref:Uncharacterized protein n=1 Tax=Nephila pilipes TaxID=299642 RepID=A0A8X6NM98_NEPPI|nr:hypothetical protein NPIL_160031 [Nephila pilipes]
MSYKQVKEDSIQAFKRPCPSRQAIGDIVNEFQIIGNVVNKEKLSSKQPTTQFIAQTIGEAINLSPKASTIILSR